MRKLLLTAVLPLALMTAAQAQSPQSSQPQAQSPSQGPSGQTSQAVQQHVRQNLQQAGFTDIQLMPSSFLVRAKDKDGNPVMMVINPDSITAVTRLPGSGNQTTGQGSSSSASPGAHSNPSTGNQNNKQ